MRRLIATSLAVSGLACAGGPGAKVGHEPGPVVGKPAVPRALYRPYVFLRHGHGAPFRPEVASLHGEPERLRPGDVIWVDGVPLRLPADRRRLDFMVPEDGRIFVLRESGALQLVGVQVDDIFEGATAVLADPLAKLSKEQRSRLWGVSIGRWTVGTRARLADLDPARSCLSGVGLFEGKESARRLRSLPPRLQCLDLASPNNTRDVSSLSQLKMLRFLSLEIVGRRVDARRIAGNRHLRALHLRCKGVRWAPSLSLLRELRAFRLDIDEGPLPLDFARRWRALRRLSITGALIDDLSPLEGLARLAVVEANATLVRKLPRRLPALRRIEIMSTPLALSKSRAFARRHPGATVLHDWREALLVAIRGADRLRVSTRAFSAGRFISKTLAELRGAAKVLAFVGGIEFRPTRGHAAVPGGNPMLTFLRGDHVLAAIGMIGRDRLRWRGWPFDARLTKRGSRSLQVILAKLGVSLARTP